MEQEKVKYLIEMINNMDINDKLRLAICMSQSKWSGLIYNTKKYYKKFDSMLKDIDEEYRTTLINFGKYKLVMFAMAKLMEMETTEQNKVALYLFNSIKHQNEKRTSEFLTNLCKYGIIISDEAFCFTPFHQQLLTYFRCAIAQGGKRHVKI